MSDSLTWYKIEHDDADRKRRLTYEVLIKEMIPFKQELANEYSKKFHQVLRNICQDTTNKVALEEISKNYELMLKGLVQEAVANIDKKACGFLDDPRFVLWRPNHLVKWRNHLSSVEKHFCCLVQEKVRQVCHCDAKVIQYKTELQDVLTMFLFKATKLNVDLLYSKIFNKFVQKITEAHPPLALEVPKLFDKVFFDTDIITPAQVQMIRNRSTTFNYEASEKQVENLVENYVLACLNDVKCYTNDVVLNCCLMTKSMLKQENLPNNLMDLAISTLYNTLRNKLISIQEKWDSVNSIVSKFKKCQNTMNTVAIHLSRGYKAENLLILSLDNWLEKNLSKAITEHIESDVVAFLKCQSWVAYPDAMQALIDKDLQDAVKLKQIDEVLDYIKNHTSNILHHIIKSKIREVSTSAIQTVVKSVELALTTAANEATSAVTNQSIVFISTLKSEIQNSLKNSGTSAMVEDMPFAKNDTMNCDEQGSAIFTMNKNFNVKDALLKKLKIHKANLESYNFELNINPEDILTKVRDESFGADDGIKPRCGFPCPRCQCPCTKVHGHESMMDGNQMQHDTYHRPTCTIVDRWAQTTEDALSLAVKNKEYSNVSDLICAGAIVNMTHENGPAPIHIAVDFQDVVLLSMFAFARGIDLNVFDENGFTPLHKAARDGLSDVVQILLKASADVHLLSQPPSLPETALTIAIKKNHTAIAKMLHQSMYAQAPNVPRSAITDINVVPLGLGVAGSVFKAKFNGQVVAIKQYKDAKDSSREIKAMRTCPSPYIVSLLGVVNDENTAIIVTFMDGPNLHEFISRKKSISFDISIFDVLWVVANALCDLHDRNFIHRDIKSDNILLCSKNYIKVADLGISRDCKSAMTQCAGTVSFIAPEVFSDSYGLSADIYSFGVVIVEMVTKKIPFAGKDMFIIMQGVRDGTLRPQLPQECAPWLKALGTACLSFDANERPTAKQIVEFLHQIPMDARNDACTSYEVPRSTLNIIKKPEKNFGTGGEFLKSILDTIGKNINTSFSCTTCATTYEALATSCPGCTTPIPSQEDRVRILLRRAERSMNPSS